MDTLSRLSACAALSLAPVIPIAFRLSQLQVLQRERLSTLALDQTKREGIEIIPRGQILDRSGRILAESLPAWSSFMDPKEISRPDQTVRALASILKIPAAEIRRKMRAKTRFVWLKRKMTLDEVRALNSRRLEGIGVVPDERRYYPNGEIAFGLLGSVGTDGAGLSGLELAFNRSLVKSPLKLRFIRDGSGRSILASAAEKAAAPPDLALTIDRNIQHYAEDALREAVAAHRPQKAVILVQDPFKGDILALANYPSDPLRNPALQDAYEPGSTYKIVTMTGVLEEHVAAAGDRVDGEGGRWLVTPSVVIKDHEPIGIMTVSEAMEKSSNIALAKLGLTLGAERLYRYSRVFGFGSRTDLALPGENAGLLKPASAMTRVTLANNSFGQGLAVTPIQLIGAYSAIANGGKLMEPRLVLRSGDKTESETVSVRQVASPATIAAIQAMLEKVVETGTGVNAQVPGYYVAGKTGTAQKIDPATGKYSSSQYVGSFIGYAPARAPRFTILVVMDSPRNGYYGADVAAPTFSKLMTKLLALEGVPAERAPRVHRERLPHATLVPISFPLK